MDEFIVEFLMEMSSKKIYKAYLDICLPYDLVQIEPTKKGVEVKVKSKRFGRKRVILPNVFEVNEATARQGYLTALNFLPEANVSVFIKDYLL